MGGHCVVILKLTDEIGRQGTDFRVWCCKEERIPVWFFVLQDRGRAYNKIYPVEEWTAKMQTFNKLRQLDAYPKVNEDFYSRTLSGGVITIVSSIFMAILFITELSEGSSTPPCSLLSNRFLLLLFSLSFSQKLDSLTEWQNFFVILAGSLGLFLSSRTTNQLVVDTARGETLTINVSVSSKQFYFLPPISDLFPEC